MSIADTYESQPGLRHCALAGVRCARPAGGRSRTTMITALKQMYENNTKDLAALKKAYEQHAEDCVQAAKLTVDLGRREIYLKMAREWTEAAAALRASTK